MIRAGDMPPASTPERMVVFTDLAHCDGPRAHEVRMVTDGAWAYAYGTHHGAVDCPPALRDGTTLTVACNQPVRGDEPCPGYVTFSIDVPGTWTAAPGPKRQLAQHGQPVES